MSNNAKYLLFAIMEITATFIGNAEAGSDINAKDYCWKMAINLDDWYLDSTEKTLSGKTGEALESWLQYISTYEEYLKRCQLDEPKKSAAAYDLLVAHGRIAKLLDLANPQLASSHAELAIKYSIEGMSRPLRSRDELNGLIDALDEQQRGSLEEMIKKRESQH